MSRLRPSFVPRPLPTFIMLLAWACGHATAQNAALAPADVADTPAPPAVMAMPDPMPVANDNEERLQVTAPYLELRSGPGRGYPVFYVVERLQWVSVELRHTDWYRVRAPRGQTGWVRREELQTTLTDAGGTKTFRDVLLEDFLHRRVELGGAFGRFKGDAMSKLWLAFKFGDAVGAEISVGQVQGVFSGSDFWHIGLTSEPWSHLRFSPFFSIGLGKFNNVPNASLVNANAASGKLAQATLGLRWHISQRFTARLDTTLYTASLSDLRSTEYRGFSAGLGFFF